MGLLRRLAAWFGRTRDKPADPGSQHLARAQRKYAEQKTRQRALDRKLIEMEVRLARVQARQREIPKEP
jgi:hypothetical protein